MIHYDYDIRILHDLLRCLDDIIYCFFFVHQLNDTCNLLTKVQQLTFKMPEFRQLHLQLVGVDGEGLSLEVPDCLAGRELHMLVGKQLAPKPGAVRLLQHKESILEFHKTLREQGILPNSCLSYVYIPAKVYSVWKVLSGMPLEGKEQDTAEFALDTVRQLVGSNTSQLSDLSSLQDLTFSSEFNESHMKFPSTLRSLTFGRHFNRSLDMTFPNGLQHITFGADFNQSLDNARFPDGLNSLTFAGDFNKSLTGVFLPETLRILILGPSFNQSLRDVNLPSGLESLIFGHHFNQSLEVDLPPGLKTLCFGHGFNQSLEPLVRGLPRLKTVTLGYGFKQSFGPLILLDLDSLTFGADNGGREGFFLPRSLRSLTLGYDFHGRIQHMKLPPDLQTLTLSNDFNQPLETLDFPPHLQSLSCGHDFNQRLDALPDSLLSLTFGANFNQRFSDLQQLFEGT